MNKGSLFKAIAGPNRLRILRLLSKKELCVCELQGVLNLSQPLISSHLRTLKNAGVLLDRREGKWVYFFVSPQFRSKEKSWFEPLLERFRKEVSSEKEDKLFAQCMKQRIDGKCLVRFEPR